MILLREAAALRPLLAGAPLASFDRATVCTGWSVRDVLAHCGAALSDATTGTTHDFTPEDNARDVTKRRGWPIDDVLDELFTRYETAAQAIDAAGGALDGIGEWIHGGDVREALGAADAYVSPGVELAVSLLLDRSRLRNAPRIDVEIEGHHHEFGSGDGIATLITDVETFVRLCGGRNPDSTRYQLNGARIEDLVLFT
jgi:uncharacterized protein (TIGR03083 family)